MGRYIAIAVLFAALLAGSSCRDSGNDANEEILPEYTSWESVPFFAFDKKITNHSYADSNLLAIAGDENYYFLKKGAPNFDFGSVTAPLNRNVKPVFTEKYAAFIGPYNDGFFIHGLASRRSLQFFNLEQTDPLLFKDPLLHTGADRNFAAINTRDQLILSLRNIEPNATAYGFVEVHLLNLNPLVGSFDPAYVQGITARRINFPLPLNTVTAYAAVGEDFLLSAGFTNGGPLISSNGIYKIKPNGEYRQVLAFENNYITQFFPFKGKLYGFAAGKFYVSQDNGESWTLLGISIDNAVARFSTVGDRLVAYALDAMYELDLDKNTLRELRNEGLEKNRITSISPFGGKVYVTTYSGVFIKDTKDFWTYKEQQ